MKIRMLLAPIEQTVYTDLTLPPTALGVMTSYLRQEGHRVRQYDLDTDLLDLYEAGGLAKEDLRFIYTKADVLNYLDVPGSAGVDLRTRRAVRLLPAVRQGAVRRRRRRVGRRPVHGR